MRCVIQIRLSVSELGRMRFAYSPLAEAAESLYMLSARRVHPVHQGWFETIRNGLSSVDMALLQAVVPAKAYIASFLFDGATDPTTTIEQQLQMVAELSAQRLSGDLASVWCDDPMPAGLRQLIGDGRAGARRLADALYSYWSVALEPHWRSMRAVLDADVAHRAIELTKGGVNAMLADLHDQVSIQDEVLRIDKRHESEEDLSGAALVLVPSVFVWPSIIFADSRVGSPSLTYPARGIGGLWTATASPAEDDALPTLIGRSRAAILCCLAVPHSTTELSLKLGQSPPAVSQHLSVLRRSGLVTSWRSGRSVLYRRTALACSIVEASTTGPADEDRASRSLPG